MCEGRRSSPRLPLDVVVNCGRNAIAHTQDISRGGLCLITDEELTPGKMLHLSFTLPGQEKAITGFAKVVWCRKETTHHFTAGLEFWDFQEDDKRAILRYMSQSVDS